LRREGAILPTVCQEVEKLDLVVGGLESRKFFDGSPFALKSTLIEKAECGFFFGDVSRLENLVDLNG
jgi:hypothetical protein